MNHHKKHAKPNTLSFNKLQSVSFTRRRMDDHVTIIYYSCMGQGQANLLLNEQVLHTDSQVNTEFSRANQTSREETGPPLRILRPVSPDLETQYVLLSHVSF